MYEAPIHSVTFVRKVPSSHNDAHITDLDKFTEYKVQIVAIGDKDNVRGRSAAHFVQTDEDGMCMREQLICKKSQLSWLEYKMLGVGWGAELFLILQ